MKMLKKSALLLVQFMVMAILAFTPLAQTEIAENIDVELVLANDVAGEFFLSTSLQSAEC